MRPEGVVERLSELTGAAAAVVGEIDLDQVLRRLVREAAAATGARYTALGVIGPHGVLTEFIHHGMTTDQADAIGDLPHGRGVLGTVVRERRTIVLDDISQHPDSYGFPPNHPPMNSFLGVPVQTGNEVFGNLYLTEKAGGFDQADAEMVEALAMVAGAAVNTARLRERLGRIAIIEDRDRIARDLHDSIIQDLFAIGLSLQGLSERVGDESQSNTLDTAVDRLDQCVEALRGFIYELRSSADMRAGLNARLLEIADRLASAYPTTVHIDLAALPFEPNARIGEEIEKLASEAMSNALRHSGAATVTITSEVDGSDLELTVIDDGSGFDQATARRGLGLLNMEERVRLLGGDLKIQSEVGEGTKVRVRVPIN